MRLRILIPATALVVAIGSGAVVVLTGRGGTTDPARRSAAAYLAAWSRADATALASLVDQPPADLALATTSLVRNNPGTVATYTLTGLTHPGTGAAAAAYHAQVDVAGFGALAWDGQLPMIVKNGSWLVHWQPDDAYPGATTGQRLALLVKWPTRASILGDDGHPLVSDGPAKIVGLEPDRITDMARVLSVLSSSLAVDPATVHNALNGPGVKPNFFVPIITIRPERLATLRPVLEPVPGVFFRSASSRLAAVDGLAPHVLGQVGEVTAERLKELGPPYKAGDRVGLSGIEAVYEKRLAGTPSAEIDLVGPAGTTDRVVEHHDGVAPQAVQVTLDERDQVAAQTALAAVAQPSALVAVDATNGELKAVVSTPAAQPFDRALDGRYPPGSTFKVVTAAALLAAGRTAATPAPCPPQITVGGLRFRNFEGEAPGAIPLHTAFAISCNTAFVGLASQLSAAALAGAAASFGFGQTIRLSLGAAGGTYPTPADPAELAASSIGQARVTASPLQMATVAATVATGQWRPPVLVLQPPPDLSPAAAPPAPLSPVVDAALQSFMAQVVASGTGTAAAVPGQQIAGKTGTAEFGTGNPPTTHAWFIGFRGNLAFAVLVEGGGVGGRVAAPVAARFLQLAPVVSP